MVVVAQLVRHWFVVPGVGSNPISQFKEKVFEYSEDFFIFICLFMELSQQEIIKWG